LEFCIIQHICKLCLKGHLISRAGWFAFINLFQFAKVFSYIQGIVALSLSYRLTLKFRPQWHSSLVCLKANWSYYSCVQQLLLPTNSQLATCGD
jgi:hypothetical protein